MLEAVLLSLAVLESPAEGGWGKAKWGMSREEVQKVYPQAFAMPSGLGLRQTEDAGHMTGGPFLEFVETPTGGSVLVSARMQYLAQPGADGALRTYRDLHDIFALRHGAPTIDVTEWADGKVGQDPKDHPSELAEGALSLAAVWRVQGGTRLTLTAGRGVTGRAAVIATYESAANRAEPTAESIRADLRKQWGASAQAVEPKGVPYAEHIAIRVLETSREEILGEHFFIVAGEVTNTGTKPVKRLQLAAAFRDKQGGRLARLAEDDTFLVDIFDDPLPPNRSLPFRQPFTGIPGDWTGKVEITVKELDTVP